MNHFFPKLKISNIKTKYFLPLYHPAAALYNGSMQEKLFKDFKKIKSVFKKINNS